MTVKELKEELEKLDNDKMVVITDGIGWTNIEKLEVKECEVRIVQETEPLFSN